MKPVVHVHEQAAYDVEEVRRAARGMLQEDGVLLRGKSVFLKPSFVYPARPPLNRGVNTQPEFVLGVCLALRDLGASRVWVGEDCLAGPSQAAFAAMGILPLLRGVAEPVYFQDEPRVEVKVEDPLVEDSFLMPRTLMEADLFISLPKLKVNMHAEVTLSVKNHIGFLLQEDRLRNHHYHLQKKIADLYRTRVPDYVIADGIRAGEGQGPMHAEPAPLNLVIGSKNGPAADAAACEAMGYKPEEVEHLRLLHEKGLGPINLEDIELCSREALQRRKRKLLRPRTDFKDYHHSLRFILGRDLACPQGCVGMIRGSLDRWWQVKRWKPIKGLAFLAGKPIDPSQIPEDLNPRRTFVIGDCAEEHRDLGTFIPGCPIPPMALTYALLKKGIHGPLATRVRDLAAGYIYKAAGR